MKRYIHSADSLTNLRQYFPKKYLKHIEEFDIQNDFDNRSNRTVYRYYAYFDDGSSISAIGLPAFQRAVRQSIDSMYKDARNE